MSKIYYCDKCKTAHHYSDCNKEPLSSDAVLGEGWRDARDEKPSTNKRIMIYTDYNGGSYAIGRYSDKTWRGNFTGEIIAWMPLPDPPAFA